MNTAQIACNREVHSRKDKDSNTHKMTSFKANVTNAGIPSQGFHSRIPPTTSEKHSEKKKKLLSWGVGT